MTNAIRSNPRIYFCNDEYPRGFRSLAVEDLIYRHGAVNGVVRRMEHLGLGSVARSWLRCRRSPQRTLRCDPRAAAASRLILACAHVPEVGDQIREFGTRNCRLGESTHGYARPGPHTRWIPN